MAKISGVADSAHARTTFIDLVDPIVYLVVILNFTSDGLGGQISTDDLPLGHILGICHSGDIKCHASILRPGNAGDGVQVY